MKKECKGIGFLNSFLSATAIVLATATHAFANNAPGPLAAVSMFSLVIVLVVLTFAGGGYGVSKRIDDAKYASKVKRTIMNTLEFIAGLVLFFVGIMATIFGIGVLSIYTIGRGVKMIQWSRAAEKDGVRPPHLEGANPKRLKLAGVVLIVLTVFIFGYSMLNLDEVTGAGQWRKRAYVSMLNGDAKNAHATVQAILADNPKARKVNCEDMVKAGFTLSPNVACFSDMTAVSGSIRITGPERWKLRKPIAVITFSGELTPAEP
jgi:hypothetical protein